MNRRQLFGLSALTALVSSYSQKAHAANATAKQSRYTPVQTRRANGRMALSQWC